MNRTKLFIALLMGGSSALISVLMFQAPHRIGPMAILLLPGFILAFVASGNIHAFNQWVVPVVNFAFYIGIVYLGSAVRRWYRPFAPQQSR